MSGLGSTSFTAAPETPFPPQTSAGTRRIFSRISLSLAPGAPLHSYRLSRADHNLLCDHLCEAVRHRRLIENAPPFVLWAAEAFRFGYDGGQYKWEFLTQSIKMETDLSELYYLTRAGLVWFGRSLRQNDQGTHYYLKTLAAEGGLPEALLADSTGKYRRLVRGLMADIDKVGMSAPRELLKQLAAHRAAILPLGFRTAEFRGLLLDFCLELLELRGAVPKSVPSEARHAWLDENRPTWKLGLPLRIESEASQSLLRDAVTAEMRGGQQELAGRLLVRVNDDWVSKVTIAQTAEVPDWLLGLTEPGLRALRLMPDTALGQNAPGLVLTAAKDETARLWDIRRESAGRKAVFTMPLDRPVAFRMVAEGRNLGLHLPLGGEPIDPDDIPTIWAAEETGDDGIGGTLRKIGASAQRSRSPYLWVLAGGEEPLFDGLDAQPDGVIGEARLWRVSGQGRVFGDGWSLAVTTSAEEDSADRIVAHGPTLPGLRDSQGMEIHRGLPAFFSQNAEGTGRNLTGVALCWRPAGRRNWTTGLPDASSAMGVHQFGWRDESGASRAFLSLLLLPERAAVALNAQQDGQLFFQASGLPVGTSVTLAGKVSGLVGPNGTLALRLGETAANLGRIPLHIRPPSGTGRPFDATLPRPGRQGYFMDAGDRILLDDIELDLGMLSGWRMIIPPDERGELQIRLVGDCSPQQPITLRVQNELSLSTYLPLFRVLMAIGGPDSELRLRVLAGASQSRRIKLRRHLREGAWSGTALTILSGDADVDPDGLNAHVVNLVAPGLSCEIDNLRPGDEIDPSLPNHSGPWLVFARDSGGLIRPPRPLQMSVNDPVLAPHFSQRFVEAGRPGRRDDRVAGFTSILQDLCDPLNSGDLCLYEMQIDELAEGEALASLDSVVALNGAPSLAAMLLLRASPEYFASRLELESASRLSWTTLPLSAWRTAIAQHRSDLMARMTMAGISETDAGAFASQALVQRLRDILDRRPEISGQVFFAAMEANLLAPLVELVAVPFGLANPEKVLVDAARRAISRHEASQQVFYLRSEWAPAAFEAFYEPMRGLLDAPLLAAEYVLSLQPKPPETEIAIALLHYRLHDPDYFETAMPAALAYIQQRK
ncbi:STY4851/ECs_5259 family protein [Tropicimonas sp. TH_r6]|uniref:STY4851/ECs_5259 family protein n=1 Tax=Tropicimonas sp. TH_r6 TaxID=3082085 RepID=UPI002954138D|nr:STY4851/ECs_5259 family protein [Tropicimonas sp. TH_r6]MDV7145642.1 STY4851/ECs_5259 family protein [Tropicimonas sp. TH_r6]